MIWPEGSWEHTLSAFIDGHERPRLDRIPWAGIDEAAGRHPRVHEMACYLLGVDHPHEITDTDGLHRFTIAIVDARLMADRALAHAGVELLVMRRQAAMWSELEDAVNAEQAWLDRACHLARSSDLAGGSLPDDPRAVLGEVDQEFLRADAHTTNALARAHAARAIWTGYGHTELALRRHRRDLYLELAACAVPIAELAHAASLADHPVTARQVRAAIAERTTLTVPDLRWLSGEALTNLTGRPAPRGRRRP